MTTLKTNGYALLIGVDDYSQFDASMGQSPGTSDLRGSCNDARAFWLMCRILGIPPENICVLTSPRLKPEDLGEDATEANIGEATGAAMVDKAQWLSSMLAGPSRPIGIMTYSGHGDWTETEGLVLCPSNTTGANLENAVPYQQLSDVFSCPASRVNLTVILDCCHSGGASDGTDIPTSRVQSLTGRLLPQRFLDRIPRIGDRVLCACTEGQQSYQSHFTAHGMRGAFSWALTVAMQQWRLVEEGDAVYLTLSYDELISRAGQLLAALSFQQTPVLRAEPNVGKMPVFHKGVKGDEGETSKDPNRTRGVGQLDAGSNNPRCYTIWQGGNAIGVILATGGTPPTGYSAYREYWKLSSATAPASGVSFTFTDTNAAGVYQDFSTTLPAFVANENPGWANDNGTDPFARVGTLYRSQADGGVYMRWNLSYSSFSSTWTGYVCWYNSAPQNITVTGSFNSASSVPSSSPWWSKSSP